MVTVRDFNDSVRRLRDSFDRRQATSDDAQDVLTRASRIDDFIGRNSVDATKARCSFFLCAGVTVEWLLRGALRFLCGARL